MRMLQSLTASLEAMQGTIEELKDKVSAIQGNEALLFDPSSPSAHLSDDNSPTLPPSIPADDGSPVIKE